MTTTSALEAVPLGGVSTNPLPKPTPLLALVCAAIVQSYDASWLAFPLAGLCRREGVAPPRVSELKRRLLDPFEQLLARSRRRGRRPQPQDPRAEARVLEALLAVAADVLTAVPIRRRDVQERLLAAAARLHRDFGLLQNAFCQKLGLSERTVRYWKHRARSRPHRPQPLQDLAPAARPRDRHRGRFRLEVTLPGVQSMADTTHLTAFGVPLHLLALQDPGDRYRSLLQAAHVELEESAEQVADLVSQALHAQPGLQLITDQGTPYLAAAARDHYDALDLDHRPQEEATPTAKATLERAFRTVKDALRPILDLSNRLAQKIPALARPTLARPVTQLLVDAFLTVYHQARSDTPHPLAGQDPETFADLAQAQRERAHAELRSKRLTLSHIHQSYRFPGSVQSFLRAHRHHALEDIQEAERRLRQKACRCEVHACDRYFAAILQRVAEEGRTRRAADRARRRKERDHQKIVAEIADHDRQRRRSPSRWFTEALDLLQHSWIPAHGRLFLDGHGMPRAGLRGALRALLQELPFTWKDQVDALWQTWASHNPHLPPEALVALRHTVHRIERELEEEHPPPSSPTSAILRAAAPQTTNLHPPPGRHRYGIGRQDVGE